MVKIKQSDGKRKLFDVEKNILSLFCFCFIVFRFAANHVAKYDESCDDLRQIAQRFTMNRTVKCDELKYKTPRISNQSMGGTLSVIIELFL